MKNMWRRIIATIAFGLVITSAWAEGPTAQNKTNSMPVVSSQWIYLPYVDRDGGTMTFTLRSAPGRGTLQYDSGTPSLGMRNVPVGVPIGRGQWFYTNTGSAPGTDTFTWQVSDGTAMSSVATMTILLTSNAAITAKAATNTVSIGAIRQYVSLSYTDPDWSQLKSAQLITPPARGTLEYEADSTWTLLNTNKWVQNTTWTYTPIGLNTGSDSFQWRITDGLSTSKVVTMYIVIAPNNVPVAKNQSVAIFTNSVRKLASLSYTHADGYQPTTFQVTALPTHGFLEYHDGINYVPVQPNTPVSSSILYYTVSPSGYAGNDALQWRVSDGISTSGIATCTYTANQKPVAGMIRATVEPGSNVSFEVSYLDPDAGQARTVEVVEPIKHGKLTISGATFTYTPTNGFQGMDMFAYKVNDGGEDSNVARGFIQVREASDRNSNLVILVVNSLLLPAISNEVYRLRDDLVNEGYSAKVRAWNLASQSSASNLWAYLRSEWDNTNQWLQGAILIGDLPKARTYAYHPYYNNTRLLYTDAIYWNMLRYQTNDDINTFNIWVTRINADDTAWGAQSTLIRRALEANHNYRTGRSRLPHTAYVFDCFTTTPIANTMLDVWPTVRSGGGGDHNAKYKFMPERTDLPYAGCDCFAAGGEVFNETSHGNAGGYMEGSWFTEAALYRVIAQERAGLIGSCTSGAFGGVVNNHIFTRGGGLVLAVGGTDINYGGDFQINSSWVGSGQPGCRARLANGDSWGGACLYSYPFDNYYTGNRIVFYGDFSMGVMASPSNAMPVIAALTSSMASPKVGQPVTFSLKFTDPDAGKTNSPFVDFHHQIEWFPKGYDSGRAAPACVTNDNGGAGWTNFTYTYSTAGTYTMRAEVMDEWRAITWIEKTIIVTATTNQLPVITEGLSVNVTMSEDGAPTAFSLTLDATDADTNTLTWSISTAAAHGTATASGTGASKTIGYMPAANYVGSDSFVVAVSDGNGGTDTIAVNLTIQPVNDAPSVNASASPASGSAPLTVVFAASGVDVDGDTLSYAWNFGDGSSASTNQNPSHVYVSAGSYTSRVTVADGNGGSASATMPIIVTVVANQAPRANAQSVSTAEDTPKAIMLSGSDPEGSNLTYTVVANPTHGTLTGTGASRTYTPAANYNGADSFTFKVNDGALDSAPATVSITVTAVNDAPTVTATGTPTGGTAPLAVAFTAVGNDVDGDTLSYVWAFGDGSTSSPQAAGTTSHTYVADGTYTATVTVSDPSGASGQAAVTITVTVAGATDTTDDHLGTITAQGENGTTEGRLKAFDNLTSTKWLDFANAYPSTRSSWIQYTYANGMAGRLTAYTITSANDVPERDPAVWQLLGSNDGGTNWVVADSRSNVVFSARFQKQTFSLTGSPTYKAYRLKILKVANPVTAKAVQLAEIELLGEQISPNQPPVAMAGVNPISGMTTNEFYFWGTESSDPDGIIVAHEWRISGTLVSTNAEFLHMFATGGTYTVTLTVRDNADASDSDEVVVNVSEPVPPVVSVAVSDTAAGEPGLAESTGKFIFTRRGDLTQAIVVRYAMSGTASNSLDYGRLSGSLTLAAGKSSATLTLTPLADALVEGVESAMLTLLPGAGYTIDTNRLTGVVTIKDQTYGKPVVTTVATDATAVEPGVTVNKGAIKVSRTASLHTALTVLATLSGTASNGVDYINVTVPVTLGVGQSVKTLTITPLADGVVDSNETVLVTITPNAAYDIGAGQGAAMVTIADTTRLQAPTVSILATDATAAEPAATVNSGTFTFSRTSRFHEALVVNYTLSGTAINGVDYNTLSSGAVTIPVGVATKTLVVTPKADVVVDSNETVIVAIQTNAAYAIAAQSTATVTIADTTVLTTPAVSLAVLDATVVSVSSEQ